LIFVDLVAVVATAFGVTCERRFDRARSPAAAF